MNQENESPLEWVEFESEWKLVRRDNDQILARVKEPGWRGGEYQAFNVDCSEKGPIFNHLQGAKDYARERWGHLSVFESGVTEFISFLEMCRDSRLIVNYDQVFTEGKVVYTKIRPRFPAKPIWHVKVHIEW